MKIPPQGASPKENRPAAPRQRESAISILVYSFILSASSLALAVRFLQALRCPFIWPAVWGCLLGIGVCIALYCLRARWYVILAVAGGMALALLLGGGRMADGAAEAAGYVLRALARIWPDTAWPAVQANPQADPALPLFLFFAGAALAAWLSFAVLWRRSFVLFALGSLPLFFFAFTVGGKNLPQWTLFLFLGACFSLIIKGQARRTRPKQAAWMSAAAMALAMLYLASLYTIFPAETYVRGDFGAGLRQQLDTLTQSPNQSTASIVGARNEPELVLQNIGSLVVQKGTALRVQGDVDDVRYLRGFSCDTYTGQSWQQGQADYPAAQLDFSPLRFLAGQRSTAYSEDKLRSIQIQPVQENLYFCYTPYRLVQAGQGLSFTADAYATQEDNSGRYTASYYAAAPNEGTGAPLFGEQAYLDYIEKVYTQLPGGQLEAQLRRLAAAAGIASAARPEDWLAVAQQVADYVQSAGTYTLSPGPQPQGEDFALYFLTESRRGFCVHFATAATVMLRALGVPARYTEGFVLGGNPAEDGWLDVPGASAHAWVEVWHVGTGWLPLEVTPGGAAPPPAPAENPSDDISGLSADDSAELSSASIAEPAAGDAVAPDGQTGATASPDESGYPSNSAAGGTQSTAYIHPADMPLPLVVTLSMYIILALLLAYVGVFLARTLVLWRRQRLFAQASSSQAAKAMCRYLYKLQKMGATLSSEAIEIAQKAYFSQHVLSKGERKILYNETLRVRKVLDDSLPWYKRLRLWILCL